MSKQQRILLAMGTRPEIIKMAPIYQELTYRGQQPLLLHTGQHTDMADTLYELFDMKPDIRLNLERTPQPANDEAPVPDGCALSALSVSLLRKISQAFVRQSLSAVLVHGDTSSALMAALAAFYQRVPVAHVEAGLRSYHDYNPFPEEMNRVLIAKLARWHFAPTQRACENLIDEGVDAARVHMVGNSIVEAAQMGAAKLDAYRSRGQVQQAEMIDRISPMLATHRMIMVTVHRRENQEYNVRRIAQTVREMMALYPELLVVWPVHPNPVVREAVYAEMQQLPEAIVRRLFLCEPLDYPVLLWVMKESWLIMTDSGGIQEEAVALRTPTLVLRDTTERPEIIEAGAGMLVGTEKSYILSQVSGLYHHPERHQAMRQADNPFGDGRTASHIANILLEPKRDVSQEKMVHAA